MKSFIDPFLINARKLDLHGYDRTGAVAMVKIFIDENIRLNNKLMIIVHGKGEGILKKSIHEYLKSDRRVLSFKTNNYNDGETIINLK